MIASIEPRAGRFVGLARHEIRAFAGHPGLRIESRRGALWITQDGDPRDVVIEAGQSHAIDREGPVYVQALDAACVLLPQHGAAANAGAAGTLWQRLALSAGLSAWSS